MDGSIAHEDQRISALDLKTEFINLFALDFPDILRDRHQLAIPDKDAARIVKLDQIRISAVKDLQNAECGICDLPHLTDGQRLHDRLHAIFQGCPV